MDIGQDQKCAKTLPKQSLIQRIRNKVMSLPFGNKTVAANKVLVEHVGIDNIKKLIVEVWGAIKDYMKAGQPESPGGEKRTPFEWITLVIKRIPGIGGIVFNIRELGFEFQDLDETEREEVIKHFADQCALPNETAEAIAEVIFGAVVRIANEVAVTWIMIDMILKDGAKESSV